MSTLQISSFKSSLKNDLDELQKELDLEEQKIIFESSSLKILKSLFSIITQNTSNIVFKEDITPILSSLLKYLSYEETSPVALLILINLQKTFQVELEAELNDSLEDLATTVETRAEKRSLFSILTELFPIQTSLCAEFFIKNDDFIKLTTGEIISIINSRTELVIKQIHSLFSLFSAACIDERCRAQIGEIYLTILLKVLKGSYNETTVLVQCMSALIIIKVWTSIKKETFEKNDDVLKLQYITEVLINGLTSSKATNDQQSTISIEGLAFLSLNITVKKSMRKDNNFVRCLLDDLVGASNTNVYGILCTLSNMTTYNKVLSKDQQSFKALKDYATMKTVDTTTGKRKQVEVDDDSEISSFVEYLLTSDTLLDKLVEVTKSKSYPTLKGVHKELIKLISNLGTEQKYRSTLVNQGALNIILSYLVNTTKDHVSYKKDGIVIDCPLEDPMTRFYAIKALSKILSTYNPTKLFSNETVEMATPVLFLLETVIEYDNLVNGSNNPSPLSALSGIEIEAEDVFDSLVALVNLSSVESLEIKDLIVRLGWPSIYGLILSEDVSVQRCTLEVLSNLVLSPVCSEKLFNWEHKDDYKNNENYRNFKMLVPLMGLTDTKSQLAILNIFANCSEFELVSSLLSKSEYFISHLLEVLKGQKDDEEIVVRCFFILLNMASLSDKNLLTEIANKENLKGVITDSIRLIRDKETIQIGIQICSSLKK